MTYVDACLWVLSLLRETHGFGYVAMVLKCRTVIPSILKPDWIPASEEEVEYRSCIIHIFGAEQELDGQFLCLFCFGV